MNRRRIRPLAERQAAMRARWIERRERRLRALEDVALKLDPSMTRDSSNYKTTVMMLAMMTVGPDPHQLAELTGYPLRDFIYPRYQRLIEAGIIGDGRIQHDWLDPERGTVMFWLDSLVADGLLGCRDYNYQDLAAVHAPAPRN